MNVDELTPLLDRLIADRESEVVEFKRGRDGFGASEIGKYFSSLANEVARCFRKAGLIEGRRPRLRGAPTIARATDTRAANIRTRGQDDALYCKQINDYLEEFETPEAAPDHAGSLLK